MLYILCQSLYWTKYEIRYRYIREHYDDKLLKPEASFCHKDIYLTPKKERRYMYIYRSEKHLLKSVT